MRYVSTFAFIALFLLVSCGVSVVTDYNSETDFGRFKSYDFYPDIASGLNDLDNTRIKRAVDSLFKQMGIPKTSNPDVLVNFYVEEFLNESRSTIGIGVGGGGNVGVGVGGGIPIGGRTVEQQFTIDIVDAVTDRLLWQGQTSGKLYERATPQQKTRHYYKLIQRITKEVPLGTKTN